MISQESIEILAISKDISVKISQVKRYSNSAKSDCEKISTKIQGDPSRRKRKLKYWFKVSINKHSTHGSHALKTRLVSTSEQYGFNTFNHCLV